MMRHALTCVLVSTFAFVGCSSSNHADAGVDVWSYHRPPVPNGALLIETSDFTIPGAAESLMCTYSSVTATDSILTREIHSYQGPGGHHAAIFYSDVSQPPGTHVCTDAEMTNWRFIGAGQESLESALNLPAGVAVRIPAGKQIVIQSHYLNMDTAPRTVRDALVIVPADPTTIQNVADSFNVFDPDLAIPAHAMYRRVVQCPIDSDMTFATVLGHTHHWGTHVTIDFTSAGVNRTIYDEVAGDRLQFSPPVHFLTGSDALTAHAGDQLRVTCEWNNTTTDTIRVPVEMCAALLYYYPGAGAQLCQTVVDTWSSVPLPDGGADSGFNGNGGCSTPWTPDQPCVRTCNTGNELGVGRYCTPGGNQCSRLPAFVCTADVDPTSPGFCTKPCTDASTCGSGSACTGDSRGMGCVPVECAAPPADAGTDAASDDVSSPADAAMAIDASAG